MKCKGSATHAWRADVRAGPIGGQVQANAPGVVRHHRGELEQLDVQGVNLGACQDCASQRQRTQPLDQHIAQRCKQHAPLIVLEMLAIGAGGANSRLVLWPGRCLAGKAFTGPMVRENSSFPALLSSLAASCVAMRSCSSRAWDSIWRLTALRSFKSLSGTGLRCLEVGAGMAWGVWEPDAGWLNAKAAQARPWRRPGCLSLQSGRARAHRPGPGRP